MSTTSGSDNPRPSGSAYPNMPPPQYPSAPPAYGQQYGAPPYGAHPYGGEPYGGQYAPQWGPPQKTGTNGFSVAALVLGILPIAGVGAILAIVFGFIARGQISRTGQSGRGMATAGIILGALWILAFIGLIVFASVHHGNTCVGTPGFCPQN